MRLEETIDFPQDWPHLDDNLMSNCDHAIDERIAAELKKVKAVAGYPGWNFHATCWWDGARGMYMAAVRRYHILQATFAAESPKDLMNDVSSEFGYE